MIKLKNILNEGRYEDWWEEFADDTVNLKDGMYHGTQSGYTLTVDGKQIKLRNGIRGNNFPFDVKIENGRIFLRYKK